MHIALKRMIIGAAVLAAAGLFGSLADDATSVALPGPSLEHHDVVPLTLDT